MKIKIAIDTSRMFDGVAEESWETEEGTDGREAEEDRVEARYIELLQEGVARLNPTHEITVVSADAVTREGVAVEESISDDQYLAIVDEMKSDVEYASDSAWEGCWE